jgi:formylglycine-generating enzyme required for sulfatase activity
MKKSIFLALVALMMFVFQNGYGQEDIIFKVNGLPFKMVFVEGETFIMNSSSEQGNSYSGEILTQTVTLPDFFMSEFQVTQELWRAIMGTNIRQQWFFNATSQREVCAILETSSTFDTWYFFAEDYIEAAVLNGEGNNYPMYFINYFECVLFCRVLNNLLADRLPGFRFTIPTEAQWEYAARGGKMSKGYRFCGSDNLDEVAWYSVNSEGTTYEVGKKIKMNWVFTT